MVIGLFWFCFRCFYFWLIDLVVLGEGIYYGGSIGRIKLITLCLRVERDEEEVVEVLNFFWGYVFSELINRFLRDFLD